METFEADQRPQGTYKAADMLQALARQVARSTSKGEAGKPVLKHQKFNRFGKFALLKLMKTFKQQQDAPAAAAAACRPPKSMPGAVLVPNHPYQKQSVTVTSLQATESLYGQAGEVIEVWTTPQNPRGVLTLSRGLVETWHVSYVPVEQVALTADLTSSHALPATNQIVYPAFVAFSAAQKDFLSSIHKLLIGNNTPNTLQLFAGQVGGAGTLTEINSLEASLLDLRLRVPVDSSHQAQVALVMAMCRTLLPDDTEASLTELLQPTKDTLARVLNFWMPVHAPSHFTVLHGTRASLEDQWSLVHFDSLEGRHERTKLAVQRLVARLGLLEEGSLIEDLSLPALPVQTDGWSCGLHAQRYIEVTRRIAAKEIPQPIQPITVVRDFANQLILKVRAFCKYERSVGVPGAKPGAAAKGKAKPKPKPAAKPVSKAPLASFEDALAAAMHCTKCRVRTRGPMLGTKGCKHCMGQFFADVQVKFSKGL
jgi:hypothetical protein